MLLVIKTACVVHGGKIADRGATHDTRHDDPKTDKQAFDLIASGRAVEANSAEAKEILEEVKAEKEAKNPQVAAPANEKKK